MGKNKIVWLLSGAYFATFLSGLFLIVWFCCESEFDVILLGYFWGLPCLYLWLRLISNIEKERENEKVVHNHRQSNAAVCNESK